MYCIRIFHILAIFIMIISTSLTQRERTLLENLVTIANEFNRAYGLFTKRQDFNYWFKTIPFKTKENVGSYYDFIIVGSGSAGSVLANRLSEVPHWRILLLEAGIPETNVMEVPLIAAALQFTQYDWGYVQEYQPNMALGLEGYRMYWPRGRALGGSTAINYMIYTRGNRIDYDRWAGQGNPGWSYEEVLPYFIKSERTQVSNANLNYHGINGYLSTEDIYQSPLVRDFINGAGELGHPYLDYNSPEHSFPVSTIQATVRRGRRHSSARAFLWPIRGRDNLDIVTSAFVTKLLIDPQTRQAYGVEYERLGKSFRVGCTREVILSAGTFNSPQLLMLAGIGPRDHLESLGIPVVQDLPVGYNLQDHITFPGIAFTINRDISLQSSIVLSPGSFRSYFTNGTGPFTSLGGAEGIAYVKTEASEDPRPYPDIELLFIDGSLASDRGVVTRKGMRMRNDVYDSLFRPIHDVPNWSIFPMLLHPRSVGRLKLRSANPYDYPLLYGNFLTDPENHDAKTFVASIRYIQRLARTNTFQRYGSTLNPNPILGCEIYPFDSDEYWECGIRSFAVTLHHQVGTVKMGPPDDPTAVVNHELKVYGIGNLRVADCSIIPFALSAHTNAPSMMVGEKAADIIKENWGEIDYTSKYKVNF